MDRIKIVQYGVTHEHAPWKIATLRGMEDLYEILGVVDDRELSRSARYPREVDMTPYQGLRLLSPEEALDLPGLQAVAVEVTNDDLVPAAMKCLERGLPIHMDKPGGQTLAPFAALVRGYEAKGLPFQMGYMLRCNPAIRFTIDFIRKGLLGEVFFIEADMDHDYGDDSYQAYLGTFRGGILYNLCCHPLDIITTIMGRPDRVTHFGGTRPGTKGTPENHSLAVLEYGPCKAILRAHSKGISDRRALTVTGTNGTISIQPLERFDGEPLTLSLFLRDDAGDFPAGRHTLDFGVQRDRYRGQFVELAKCIRGEIETPDTYGHDLMVQEVLLEMCR